MRTGLRVGSQIVLTDIDRSILRAIGEGYRTPEIAARMGFSRVRVTERLKTMRDSLGLRSFGALYVWAGQERFAHASTAFSVQARILESGGHG